MSSIIPVVPLTGAISGTGKLSGSLSPEGLQISGTVSSDTISAHKYEGPYVVAPRKVSQTLNTSDKFMVNDLEVEAIRYSEVSNPAGGLTANIGYE